MSDIVIDRERLVVLQKHLKNIEPGIIYEGTSHDEWVFAMQNIANMLGPTNAAIPLCPSCKNNDVCWFGGTDVILCRHYVKTEPVKFPIETEPRGADRYATVSELDKALNTLTERIMVLEQRQALAQEDISGLVKELAEQVESHVDHLNQPHLEHYPWLTWGELNKRLQQAFGKHEKKKHI